MPNLNDLIKDDNQEVDWDNLGEQRGNFQPPPIPGDGYVWALPKDLGDCIDVIHKDASADGTKPAMDRISLNFRETGLPCVASRTGFEGQAYTGSITNFERNRARKNEPKRMVSDLQYLYRDGLGGTEKPKNQAAFGEALKKHGGQQFGSSVEWNWYCNKNKVRYISDGNGGSAEDPSGQTGCGTSVYQSNAEKDENGVPFRTQVCPNPECQAMLLANANLVRFKQIS